MVKCISVCGDSFGLGAGIDSNPTIMYDKSFGTLVADYFNLPVKIYARSGCCNFVISLQVQKIIQQFTKKIIPKPFVLITTTHHSRFSFPIEDELGLINYDLADVDYITHNVFESKSKLFEKLPFRPNDKSRLISDTLSNWLEFKKNKLQNLAKNFTMLQDKLSTVDDYFQYLYSDIIKQEYDIAMILKMHVELKSANLPHIIMSGDQNLKNYIDKENFLFNNWGHYIQKYPDSQRTGHCNQQGHREVADNLIVKINETRAMFPPD